MYSRFITLFSIVYIDWCIVYYLLSLLACMCVCDAIDGAPFEDYQEQGFEDAEQQQHFEQGKWTLESYLLPHNLSFNSHLLYMQCMSL